MKKPLLPLLALAAFAAQAHYSTSPLPVGVNLADSICNDSICYINLPSDSLVADSLDADSVFAALPYPERCRAALDSLLAEEMFCKSQVGLMVYDLDGDSVVYAHGERQLLRPASTMKVLTAVAALDHLGARHRMTTTLRADGERDSTTLRGNLYLHGTMNPLFGDYDMDCFVEGVKALGVDTIIGGIVADRSFKEDTPLGEGWCWDDDNPALTPLPYRRRDNFAAVLRQRLERQGLAVLGADSIGRAPHDAVVVAERYADLTAVLYKMMKDSDNMCAEAVFYQLGAAGGKTSTAERAKAAERETLRRANVANDACRIADGSGLSLYNYMTAETEVKVLRYAYHNKKVFGELCQSLPRAGVDGTLRRRMRRAPMLDNVRAKTGTVKGVSSLAGYATAPNGNLMAFCIINQGITSSAAAHRFQDNVCRAICE